MGRKDKHCISQQDMRAYQREFVKWLQEKSVAIIDSVGGNNETVEGEGI